MTISHLVFDIVFLYGLSIAIHFHHHLFLNGLYLRRIKEHGLILLTWLVLIFPNEVLVRCAYLIDNK
ncbi:hypothetical protein BDW74DRAFT_27522 [Aspergillus multicolor]|uniref:uncharacterized protein n=1 Tax=Aspergillus multicolor TaxID=41759 RepID=UPI003CCCA1B6